ncbi:HNH endonuclease [Rhizobium ruizarguesonis]|uniref:HNH endonuclease n=1 Tax=Rhizobium TaxID=379 RepID=UPI0010323663|nr:HNH endonuclease [Rhizobium ruizarguesonis]TBC98998.1 HNH endonuclease [Rhizobium ruizarguesonis]TBE32878.1 HNH endonuclease [Rhizobium ruizarguesonis]
MSWGFERGRIYNRRQDIHGRFGGQQQGGIITPAQHGLVIIVTGEEGLTHGYTDRVRPDGVFEYFGEGQLGDMQMLRGNAAIARHSAEGRSLLLFRKTAAGLRFEGEMVYENHHIERAPDRNQTMRDAIVFELRPLENVVETVDPQPLAPIRSLEAMRELAFAATNLTPERRLTMGSVFERSRNVRDYVNARSRGHCEGCGDEAPFRRTDGSPYLEPHHIRRLSDGGPDDPRYVIALCPNCHRRVHFGDDGKRYNGELATKMRAIEASD